MRVRGLDLALFLMFWSAAIVKRGYYNYHAPLMTAYIKWLHKAPLDAIRTPTETDLRYRNTARHPCRNFGRGTCSDPKTPWTIFNERYPSLSRCKTTHQSCVDAGMQWEHFRPEILLRKSRPASKFHHENRRSSIFTNSEIRPFYKQAS